MVYIHLERWFATRDNLATPPPGDLTMSRDNPVVTTLRTERVVPGISQVETHYTVKHPSGHESGTHTSCLVPNARSAPFERLWVVRDVLQGSL